MISSLTPLRRAAPTWADQTYAASRSRTAARMAIERSEGSVTVSSRKNVTRLRIFSASLGLCSSMLNGPRTPPKTLMTESTTAWCSAGTSDLPVMGAMRGMAASFARCEAVWVTRSGRARRPRSADPDAVLLEGGIVELEAEPRRLGQRHVAVDDGRPLAEQLEPERVARGIGE